MQSSTVQKYEKLSSLFHYTTTTTTAAYIQSYYRQVEPAGPTLQPDKCYSQIGKVTAKEPVSQKGWAVSRKEANYIYASESRANFLPRKLN